MNSGTNSPSKELGTVLIFFALVIVSLVGIVALALDISRGLLERSQSKGLADRMALAALRSYDTSADPDLTHRFTTAKDVALEILSNNKSIVRGGASFDSAGATIESGRWWAVVPEGCMVSSCPCGSGTEAPPCFQSCTNGSCDPVSMSDTALATAMRVNLNSTESSSIKTTFANIFGDPSIKVGTSSAAGGGQIAAIAPQHIMIFFDLSRRIVYEKDLSPFKHGVPGAGQRSSFPIFVLNRYAPCPAGLGHTWTAPPFFEEGYSSIGTTQLNVWSGLTSAEKDQYRCFSVKDPMTGDFDRSILVDITRDFEPYHSMLNVARGIVDEFKATATQQDRLGLIGAPNMSFTYFGGDLDILGREILPSGPGSASMDELTQLLADGGTTSRILRASKGFVPYGHFPLLPVVDYEPGDDAMSWKPEDFRRAERMLTTLPNSGQADKSIVMVVGSPSNWGYTNGPFMAGSPPLSCGQNDGVFSYGGLDIWMELKKSQFNFVDCTVRDVSNRSNVKVHTMPVGQALGPHTVLVPSYEKPGTCMTDLEKRNRNYLDIQYGSDSDHETAMNRWGDITPPDPVYGISAYYYLASRLSKGMYRPVRPPCPSPYSAGITDLNSLCSASIPDSLWDPSSTEYYVVHNLALETAKVMDSFGRLMCDPDHLTPYQQGQALTNNSFKQRSYILVD